MESLAANPTLSQAKATDKSSYPGRCKSCSGELVMRQKGMHVGVYCFACGAWQQWISKHKAHRYQQSAFRSVSTPIKPATAPKPASQSVENHADCAERFEEIEHELTILTRAILSFGTPRGQTQPEIHVDDQAVDRLALELEEERR
jgi:hypothetical protein